MRMCNKMYISLKVKFLFPHWLVVRMRMYEGGRGFPCPGCSWPALHPPQLGEQPPVHPLSNVTLDLLPFCLNITTTTKCVCTICKTYVRSFAFFFTVTSRLTSPSPSQAKGWGALKNILNIAGKPANTKHQHQYHLKLSNIRENINRLSTILSELQHLSSFRYLAGSHKGTICQKFPPKKSTLPVPSLDPYPDSQYEILCSNWFRTTTNLMALSPLKEEALAHGVSGIGSSENQSHLIINIQIQ